MKKTFKFLMLTLTMISLLAGFMVMASAVDVPSSYLGASDYLISDGTIPNASQPIFKDGKVTFKINLASGVTVTGALVTVKFDKSVLRVVDAGPVTTTDEEGNKTEIVTGMHTHGFAQYDDSAYTFAYISANGYKTGNSGKEFAYITFEVIDKNYPLTTVEFVAGNYASTEIIKEYKNFTTIDAGNITSFEAGKNSITINWKSIPGATEYLLYRKGGEDSKFRVLATVSGITYKDSENIANNTTYTYAVRGKTQTGDYGWYVGQSFSYMDTVAITVTNEKSGVKVAWDKVDGATSYKVYKRELEKNEWVKLKEVEGDILTVTDKDVISGESYEYSVSVCRNGSESSKSDAVKINCVRMVSQVTLANHADGVSIKWTEVNGAENYRVYRKLKGESSWTRLATLSNKTTSYVDKGATSGELNYYTVRVYSAETWSAYETYGINYIATPKVRSTSTAAGKGVTLNWGAVPGAAKYRVYRASDDGKKWVLQSTVTTTSYTDKNVTLGKSYKYTLRAENSSNLSSYVKEGWTVQYTLATPSVSKVTTTSNSIKIQWGAVSGAEGYRVYRKANGESKWSQVAKVTGTTYTDKNVKVGSVYTYTLRAYKGSTLSAYNKSGWVGVILKTPTVKIANAATGVKVSWSKVSGAAGYTVYSSQYDSSTGKWSSWKNRGTTKATTISWVDTKTTSGTKYKYTVRAVNGLCKSDYKSSNELLYLAQPTVKIANVDGGINVSWTKATGATGYRVYRSQYDIKTSTWTSWKNMGTAKANKTSWVDKSVVDGTTYKYTVRTVNGNVLSSYAASSNLKFLKTPKLLSCVNTEEGIVVSFEKNKNADSYNVYRKTNYTNWVLLATISDTEYTDKDVIQGTEYIYTVRSISGKSMSYYNKTGISVQV